MTKRPTTNSLGKPIASTPEAIENFYKWFGDSKVVDEKGRPLVVFHGTNKYFKKFSLEYAAEGGIFFSENINYAHTFGKNLLQVFCVIKNPLYKQGETIPKEHSLEDIEQIIHEAKSNKKDGIFISNFNDYGNVSNVWIAFDGSQIKSATGNNGNFSKKEASILNGIEDPDEIINPASYKNQFEINQAIEQLIKSKGEDTKSYSLDEKQFIRLYSGSGGLASQGATGKGILYEFFTPEYICDLMYELARAHGYDSGTILEPSCGTGELIRPASDYSKVTAFEINPTSAAITRILYPGVQVYADYFETAFMQQPRFSDVLRHPRKTWLTGYPFSLVVGNPPYGRYQSLYSRYFDKKLFKQVEIFFIIQGLALLKPGGLLVYIQSSNFLRNGDKYDEAKEYINRIADIVDAYRLPSVFKYSEVPTDIMILRKK